MSSLEDREQVALNLILEDYQFIFSIFKHNDQRNNLLSYLVAVTPLIGLIINESVGLMKHIKSLESYVSIANKNNLQFYAKIRSSLKFYDKNLNEINTILNEKYNESSLYFSNQVISYLRMFKIHNRYGMTCLSEQKTKIPIANTINSAVILPNYTWEKDYSTEIKSQNEIDGNTCRYHLKD